MCRKIGILAQTTGTSDDKDVWVGQYALRRTRSREKFLSGRGDAESTHRGADEDGDSDSRVADVVNKQIRNYLSVVVVLLAVAATAHAADRSRGRHKLNWDQDVRQAWKSAHTADRPLLMFLTMDGCLYCQKMKKTTLQDRHVVNDLQSQFVSVALNIKDAPDLVEQLKVKSFPTTVIIQTNGDVIESISGYQTPSQLRQRLHATLRQVARERNDTVSR